MSNFIPSVEKTINFEGDKVEVLLRPFKMQAFFKIMPEIQAYNQEIQRIKWDDKQESVDETKINPQVRAKMMQVAAEVLPEHVEMFKGLKDANGGDVELETALDTMYFMPLVAELINELIAISNLGRTEKEQKQARKNSERQPQDSSQVRSLKAQV